MRKLRLRKKLSKVKMLVFDVDGTFTDGNVLHPRFDAHDGYGIKRLQQAGINVAMISNRFDLRTARRAEELGVLYVPNCNDKKGVMCRLVYDQERFLYEVCYVGDDVTDLACMGAVAVAVAVRNAVAEVKRNALFVTKACGGYGAIREVCDLIMHSRR